MVSGERRETRDEVKRFRSQRRGDTETRGRREERAIEKKRRRGNGEKGDGEKGRKEKEGRDCGVVDLRGGWA